MMMMIAMVMTAMVMMVMMMDDDDDAADDDDDDEPTGYSIAPTLALFQVADASGWQHVAPLFKEMHGSIAAA
eukprot:3504840-Karenia_brevis.AAC.1